MRICECKITFIAFLIKIPIYLFNIWLPKALVFVSAGLWMAREEREREGSIKVGVWREGESCDRSLYRGTHRYVAIHAIAPLRNSLHESRVMRVYVCVCMCVSTVAAQEGLEMTVARAACACSEHVHAHALRAAGWFRALWDACREKSKIPRREKWENDYYIKYKRSSRSYINVAEKIKRRIVILIIFASMEIWTIMMIYARYAFILECI